MRYAVYFVPPRWHPLAQRGQAWFADDAAADPLRAAPARYGFHATLKAPITLAPGVDAADWLAAVRALALRHRAFAMPRLEVAMLSDFIALRPADAVDGAHPLRQLADACVRELDAFRAPMSEAEFSRQMKPGLSERQRRQVTSHGYPHVFEDWRFHMTLSAPLDDVDPPRAQALRSRAAEHFGPALELPLEADALCVFAEPASGAAFTVQARFPLAPR